MKFQDAIHVPALFARCLLRHCCARRCANVFARCIRTSCCAWGADIRWHFAPWETDMQPEDQTDEEEKSCSISMWAVFFLVVTALYTGGQPVRRLTRGSFFVEGCLRALSGRFAFAKCFRERSCFQPSGNENCHIFMATSSPSRAHLPPHLPLHWHIFPFIGTSSRSGRRGGGAWAGHGLLPRELSRGFRRDTRGTLSEKRPIKFMARLHTSPDLLTQIAYAKIIVKLKIFERSLHAHAHLQPFLHLSLKLLSHGWSSCPRAQKKAHASEISLFSALSFISASEGPFAFVTGCGWTKHDLI